MKLRRLISLCLIAVSLGFASCGSDEEPDPRPGSADGVLTTKYVATNKVKKASLSTNAASEEVCVYYDLNRKYVLAISESQILLKSSIRRNGKWEAAYGSDGSAAEKRYYFTAEAGINMVNVGKVTSLQQITHKPGVVDVKTAYPDIVSSCGYVASFLDENGDVKYMRLRITEFVMYASGALKNLNVEYQLF